MIAGIITRLRERRDMYSRFEIGEVQFFYFFIANSARVEQISQWAQRPAMDRFRDIRAASDENYIVNIFIYIMSSLII